MMKPLPCFTAGRVFFSIGVHFVSCRISKQMHCIPKELHHGFIVEYLETLWLIYYNTKRFSAQLLYVKDKILWVAEKWPRFDANSRFGSHQSLCVNAPLDVICEAHRDGPVPSEYIACLIILRSRQEKELISEKLQQRDRVKGHGKKNKHTKLKSMAKKLQSAQETEQN